MAWCRRLAALDPLNARAVEQLDAGAGGRWRRGRCPAPVGNLRRVLPGGTGGGSRSAHRGACRAGAAWGLPYSGDECADAHCPASRHSFPRARPHNERRARDGGDLGLGRDDAAGGRGGARSSRGGRGEARLAAFPGRVAAWQLRRQSPRSAMPPSDIRRAPTASPVRRPCSPWAGLPTTPGRRRVTVPPRSVTCSPRTSRGCMASRW